MDPDPLVSSENALLAGKSYIGAQNISSFSNGNFLESGEKTDSVGPQLNVGNKRVCIRYSPYRNLRYHLCEILFTRYLKVFTYLVLTRYLTLKMMLLQGVGRCMHMLMIIISTLSRIIGKTVYNRKY